MPESLIIQTFTDKMKDVLANWPLYRQLRFLGKVTQHYSTVRASTLFTADYAALPEQVEMFCPGCCKQQRWTVIEPYVEVLGAVFKLDGDVKVVYKCRNCGIRTVTYFLLFEVTKEGGSVVKVGQYPALELDPPPLVAAGMGKGDLLLYRH